jgi:hypothetical protein
MFKPKQKTIIHRTCPDFKRCVFNKHVCRKTSECTNAKRHYHYFAGYSLIESLGIGNESPYNKLCLGVALEFYIIIQTDKAGPEDTCKHISSGTLRANDGISILPYKIPPENKKKEQQSE